MDKQNKNLYFPLFYKHESLLAKLSETELGALVFAILSSEGRIPPKAQLNDKLEIIYNLVVNDAEGLYERKAARFVSKKETAPKDRYGDFDPDEVFQKALARSYSKN